MKKNSLLCTGLLTVGLAFGWNSCNIDSPDDNLGGSNPIGNISGGGEEERDSGGGDPFCPPFCQAAITCFGEEAVGTEPECVEECNGSDLAIRECVARLCNRPTENDSESLECVLFAACILSCDALVLDTESASDTDSLDTETLLELVDTDTANWIPCANYVPTGSLFTDYCCQESFPDICFELAFNGFCNCNGTCFWDSGDCL